MALVFFWAYVESLFENLKGNDLLNKCIESARINYELDNVKLTDGYLDINRINNKTKLVSMWEFLNI